MTVKNEQSPEEDSQVKKAPAWVFDESIGWIDVNDFLSKTSKLSEELHKKIAEKESK